ncbi:ATP-dependent endonuclease [Hymenobacter setariae]|uniref:ATP-dependent endonuclease n=1 Tax=Hymenobacter setariae TaxID=2594794 RepID=UPI001F17B474|nr:ATP-dependent endonuclease [Hymenobacter setariae]
MKEPIQIDPTISEFQNRKLQALLTRLGQEHKLALFCHTPLLVEGPSDEIICSALSRKLGLNLEAAGSQILPVTGKGQFAIVVKLFRLIGKVPALLADADAITDDLDIISVFTNQALANKIASEMGHRDAPKFAKDIYDDFCKIVLSNWDDLKVYCATHYYWVNRDMSKDEVIAKRRSVFCWLMSNGPDSLGNINNAGEWTSIRNRLITLLDFLERLGCFILRKGTIEAYYKHAATLTNDQKPNAASYEVNGLLEDSVIDVKVHYCDIVRSMVFCSSAKEINESEAIRDLLLAIVSPALASINSNTTEAELRAYSNNLFGAKSSLFHLSVLTENNDVYLNVDISSKILDVLGFPLKIKKGSNPIEVVNTALRLI